jgi:hypothetical protein
MNDRQRQANLKWQRDDRAVIVPKTRSRVLWGTWRTQVGEIPWNLFPHKGDRQQTGSVPPPLFIVEGLDHSEIAVFRERFAIFPT